MIVIRFDSTEHLQEPLRATLFSATRLCWKPQAAEAQHGLRGSDDALFVFLTASPSQASSAPRNPPTSVLLFGILHVLHAHCTLVT